MRVRIRVNVRVRGRGRVRIYSAAFSGPSAVVAAAVYSSMSAAVTAFSLSAVHMRDSIVSTWFTAGWG